MFFVLNKIDLKREKVVFLLLFVVAVCTLFFPFRIEVTGGYSVGLFGGGTYHPTKREIKTGFDVPIVFVELLLMLGSGVLMIFVSKLWAKITALVILILTIVLMLLMYAALGFHLDLFGPKTFIYIGTGYYFLAVDITLFTLFMVVTFIRTYKKSKVVHHFHKKGANDLLDN